jgi:hypothetical protein
MKFRVWTLNFNGGVSLMTDWQTLANCKKMILGRWGHWPPFAFMSAAKTAESFRRANCPNG